MLVSDSFVFIFLYRAWWSHNKLAKRYDWSCDLSRCLILFLFFSDLLHIIIFKLDDCLQNCASLPLVLVSTWGKLSVWIIFKGSFRWVSQRVNSTKTPLKYNWPYIIIYNKPTQLSLVYSETLPFNYQYGVNLLKHTWFKSSSSMAS